jgi:hypothetical protein
VLSVALLCAQVSFRMRAPGFESSFDGEFLILQGRHPYPEFHNHILAPGLLWLSVHALPGVAAKSVWALTRFVEASAGFLVVYGVGLGLSASRFRGLVAVALVAFAYLWTPMTFATENTTDFFDIMFMALMVWCVAGERPIALGAVTILAAANRESAPFAGVMWVCVMAARYGIGIAQWPRLALGGVYMVLGMAVVYGLRYGLSQDFRPQQYLGIQESLRSWHDFLHPTGIVPMVGATVLVYGATLARIPRPWPPAQRGLLFAAFIIAALTATIAIIGELRSFLSCWTVLALIAVADRQVSDRQWIASAMGWQPAAAVPPH